MTALCFSGPIVYSLSLANNRSFLCEGNGKDAGFVKGLWIWSLNH